MSLIYTTQIGSNIIQARPTDNYINATQLCKSNNKEYKNWKANDSAGNIVNAFGDYMYAKLFDKKNKDFLVKVEKSLLAGIPTNTSSTPTPKKKPDDDDILPPKKSS